MSRRPSRLLLGLRARPRLLLSTLFGIGAWLALAGQPIHSATRGLLAWNLGAGAYLLMAWLMMSRATPDQLCKRALHQDDGQLIVLMLSIFASLAVLMAAGSQMAIAKDMHGALRTAHIGLAAATVVVAWLFVQTTFALHYAHDFFLARIRGEPDGLEFPGTTEPRYVDFMYFSVVIGTSGQTADISFVGSSMRLVGMVHCVLAFFFNVAMVGLTINIAASLF